MTRRSLWLFLTMLSCAWGLSVPTQAQIPSNMTVTIREGGESEELKTTSNKVYISKARCQDNATYKFEITPQAKGSGSGGTIIPVLEIWAGQDDINCANPDNRTIKQGGGTQTKCWLVARATDMVRVGNKTTIDNVKGSDIFDADRNDECDTGSPLRFGVYFLPLPSNTVPESGSAPMVVETATTVNVGFTLLSQLPDAPDGLSGRSGESRIGASWDPVTTVTKTTYRAYFDVGGGAGDGEGASDGDAGAAATCGSGVLVGGKAAPAADDQTVFSVSSDGTSASLSGLDAKGVDVREQVAVAVVAVDISGNRSLLSDPICVERVPTSGFWEQCAGDPSCEKDFEQCSVTPGPGRAFSYTATLLVAAALWLARRRRNV